MNTVDDGRLLSNRFKISWLLGKKTRLDETQAGNANISNQVTTVMNAIFSYWVMMVERHFPLLQRYR
jgi:hypothetical protein